MKLFKPLKIGDLQAELPIIQGGMGVGVSLSGLASAVANEGGIGIISCAQPGFEEPDFKTNTSAANVRAIKKHMEKARKASPNGIIGCNILVALIDYDSLAKAAVENGADVIISGAGLPLNLPKFVINTPGAKTKLLPIVSTAKAAEVLCRFWESRYKVVPDGFVVEGPLAGGHLGYSYEELKDIDKIDFKGEILRIKEVADKYGLKHNKTIPIIAAGGIYSGEDILDYLELGCSAVQMATRFVTTVECDAHINFKNAYLKAEKDDIHIVKSPVGMPGRAIRTDFTEYIMNVGRIAPIKCVRCVAPCIPKTTIYCITEALIEAVKGRINDGLVFCGQNAYLSKNIVTVKQLITTIKEEITQALALRKLKV